MFYQFLFYTEWGSMSVRYQTYAVTYAENVRVNRHGSVAVCNGFNNIRRFPTNSRQFYQVLETGGNLSAIFLHKHS